MIELSKKELDLWSIPNGLFVPTYFNFYKISAHHWVF